MMRPVRLQLSRKRGFNLQALSLATNGLPAVNVARPTRFGNPCTCQSPYSCPYHKDFERWAWEDENGDIPPLRCCVDVFRHYVETGLRNEPTRTGRLCISLEAMAGYPDRRRLVEGLPSLRGKNLACWCALDAGHPCHADVLLELANGEPE